MFDERSQRNFQLRVLGYISECFMEVIWGFKRVKGYQIKVESIYREYKFKLINIDC